MPFVSTLHDGDTLNYKVFSRENEHISVVEVGYDDSINARYSVMVALSPLAGGDIEHVFTFVSARDNKEKVFYSGLDTKVIVSQPEHRASILSLICQTTYEMVKTVKPGLITHVTHGAYPNDKPLGKHLMIMREIESCGYTVSRPDPYNGRHVWIASRND